MTTTSKRFTDAATSEHTILCGVCDLDGFSDVFPSIEARQAHYDETGHCPIQEWFERQTGGALKKAFPGTVEMSDAEKAELARMAPEHRAAGTKLRGRQHGTADEPATPAQKRFADQLGITVAGLSKKQASRAIDAAKKSPQTAGQAAAKTGATAVVNPPTAKQTEYVRKLISERDAEMPAVKAIRDELNVAKATGNLSRKLVSDAIDKLKKIGTGATSTPAMSAPQKPAEAPKVLKSKTNQYPGKCGSCGQKVEAGEGIWQLDDEGNRGVFHLDGQCPLSDLGIPTGRYAVEHEGVLKFYVIKPNGLFVMASDEEHRITKKDRQVEIAELIKVDPMAAMRRYGHEIGKCGRCGRTLTDEISRANGIGPICESKAFG